MSSPRTGVLLMFLASGCGGGDNVPLPDLAGVEPPVRAKITALYDAVVARPSGEVWGAYGRTLDAHGMYEAAEHAYLKAAELTKGPAAFGHLHLAGVAAWDRRPERAVRYFERALALRDDVMATHLQLATLLERLERLDAARARYELVVSRWSSGHAHLGLGRLALGRGDAETALAHLKKAEELDPEHSQVHEALARCYARLGRLDDSRAAAARAGNLMRKNPFPDPLLAFVDAESVQAVARFRSAAKLMAENKDIEAIHLFRAGLQGRPGDLLARYYLAMLLERNGRAGEAQPVLDSILAEDPEHARALELRARILLAQDQKDAARQDLQALLAVDPEHAWAKEQLGK